MKHELLQLIGDRKPIEAAKLWYDLLSDVPFEDDLADYLMNGWVVSRPTCFWMMRLCDARPLDDKGNPIGVEQEPAWFVRFSCGGLPELLSTLPFYLPKIIFCRNGPGKPKSDKLRVYRLDRLIRLAAIRARKGNS
jgi:hypothetical protein